MENGEQIPTAVFADALDDLDPAVLAAFTADLYRAAGNEVTADPPDLIVHTDDGPVRMRAVSDEADTGAADAVVSAHPDIEPGCPVVGPGALRQRLLYALDPGTADELCERHLGQPVRSTEYASDGPSTDEGPADSSPSAGTPADAPGSGLDADTAGERSSASHGPAQSSGTPAGTRRGGLQTLVGSQTALLAILVVLVFATGVGAVFVGGLSPAGADADQQPGETPTPAGDRTPTPTASPTPTPTPTPASDESDDNERVRPGLGSNRYATLRPTCNRSFLNVVQIQMNALKFNDNETNDGIRTVRRFASPQNREAVGDLAAYVRIIQRESYAPMLTYDSAEYEPRRFAADTARVQVTTRENGNVTARYVFRLGRQDGGEYDGCWMTEGVRPLTEATGSDVE